MWRMEGSIRTLAGRYRLEEVVGRGGMSTVYRATDLVLGRTVAVKLLLDALAAEDPVHVARFEREARAAAALANPAVVTVYDTGVDGATRFIVMELVEGKSVATMLRERGALGVDESVAVAQAVAGALASAHAAGILHRDIKPANVMVSPGGAVKVLDFGIARAISEATVTHARALIGTVAYMAPERASGASGDERSDLYSLGCLLYAMLTGSPPFRGELPAAVLHQHLSAMPVRVGELAAGVAPALDALVAQLLAKDPAHRPQSAAEVRERLTALRGGATAATAPLATAATAPLAAAAPEAARRAVPRAGRVTAAPAELAAVTRVMPRPRLPSGVPVLGTILAAVILIAGIAVLLAGGGSGNSSVTTTSRPPRISTSPRTSTRSTTARTSSSTTAPTSTVTLTRTATATSSAAPKPAGPASGAAAPTPPGTPPGHGGTPPGQAKKH